MRPNSRLQRAAWLARKLWLRLRSWLAFGSLRLYSLRRSGMLMRLAVTLMRPPLKRKPLDRLAVSISQA